MNRATLLLLALLATTVFACRSSEETNSEKKEEATEMQRPPDPGPGIPPGQCQIVGTIVAVNAALSMDTNDPCSKAPCKAIVRVVEVEGYGMGFESRIGNREISVTFVGTVGDLKIGSRFRANVLQGSASINDAGKEPEFRIANFTIL